MIVTINAEIMKQTDAVQSLFQDFMVLHRKCHILISEEERDEEDIIVIIIVIRIMISTTTRNYISWLNKQRSPSFSHHSKSKSSQSGSSSHRSSGRLR